MNIIDEEDKRIYSVLNAQIYEHDSYTETIFNALYRDNSKKAFNISRFIIAIIAGLTLISGIAYAKQIEKLILRFFNNSEGIDRAIESGYIEEIDKELDTTSEMSIKIINMVMDQKNINFDINISFGKLYDVLEITDVYIDEAIIFDDANNILYCNSKTLFDKYCLPNNIKQNYTDYNNRYINDVCNGSIAYQDIESNSMKLNYNIYAMSKLPKSKQLHIKINALKLRFINGKEKSIKDNWEATIDLPSKFSERETQIYVVTECSEPNIDSVKFEVYNTCSILELVYNDNTNKKDKNFFEWGLNSKHKVIEDVHIKDNDGNKYYKEEAHSSNSIMIYNPDGTLHYKETFSLTQYDATETLTIHFTMYTMEGSKDVVIKLKRNS